MHKRYALCSSSLAAASDMWPSKKLVGKIIESKRHSEEQVANMKIIRTLAKYLWLKDNFEFCLRVVLAMGLLIGSKVLNVQVPYLFKLAVDWLSTTTGTAATSLTSFSNANTTMLTLFVSPAAF